MEKPHIHFIAHCRSSEDEQIAYTETRLSCIQETADKMKTLTGTDIHDTVRCFKGDSPARQFEDGQQKGGNYFCNCSCHASRIEDIAHAQSCSPNSLQQRVNTIMKPGTTSRSNTLRNTINSLAYLSIEELEKELGARGIYEGKTKKRSPELA